MEVKKNIDISNNKIIYKSLIKKRILIINIIIILLLLLFLLNISVGSTSISIKEILKAIFINEGEEVFTSRFYPSKQKMNVEVFNQGSCCYYELDRFKIDIE